MDYCGPLALPRSKFLGRVPGPGESEWTDLDREYALEWSYRNRTRCPSCGTPPMDWDPERGGDPEAYRPEPSQCWGCKRRDDVKLSDSERSSGYRVHMLPNTDLTMWGGLHGSSAAAKGVDGDGAGRGRIGRYRADAGDAERSAGGDPAEPAPEDEAGR